MSFLKDRRGIGMLELLISLSLIVAATYWMMNRQMGSGQKESQSQAIEKARQRAEAQGIQFTSSAADSTHPGATVEKIVENQGKAADCASTETAGCRVDSLPQAPPQALPQSQEQASSSN
jgi:hypothetical protein